MTEHLADILRDIPEPKFADDYPDDEEHTRAELARETRDRVPPFLRHAKRAELEQRFTDPRLKNIARAWTWGHGNALLIGPSDFGKTTACGILFRRLLGNAVKFGGDDWDKARSMYWFSAEQLVWARRNHPLGQGDPPEIVSASMGQLVVLDDLGWDRDPEPVSAVLAYRYEKQLPTIVTSGRTREELMKHYGAPVVKRMLEAGGRAPIIVDGFEKPPSDPRAGA